MTAITTDELYKMIERMTATVRKYRESGMSPGEGRQQEEVRAQEAELQAIFGAWKTEDILFLVTGLLYICQGRPEDKQKLAIYLEALCRQAGLGRGGMTTLVFVPQGPNYPSQTDN